MLFILNKLLGSRNQNLCSISSSPCRRVRPWASWCILPSSQPFYLFRVLAFWRLILVLPSDWVPKPLKFCAFSLFGRSELHFQRILSFSISAPCCLRYRIYNRLCRYYVVVRSAGWGKNRDNLSVITRHGNRSWHCIGHYSRVKFLPLQWGLVVPYLQAELAEETYKYLQKHSHPFHFSPVC